MPFVKLGRYGFATRDCPNVILPVKAAAPGLVAGASVKVSWGDPSWKTFIPAPETAGHIHWDLLLTHIVTGLRPAALFTADVAATSESYFFQVQVASGATGAESVRAEGQLASSIVYIVTGLGVGGWVSIGATETHGIAVSPAIFPRETRIAVRGTISGAPGVYLPAIYLMGYDASAHDFAPVLACPANDELLQRGLRASRTDLLYWRDAVTISSHVDTAWGDGDWVDFDAVFDDDYLITGAYAMPSSTLCESGQIELALGAGHNIQARYPAMVVNYSGATTVVFKWPFIAYEGEQLSARISSLALDQDYLIGVQGVKLNEWLT